MKNMTRRIVCALILAFGLTSIVIAAEPNFAGTWKLNLSKSQLGGVAYTFDKKPSGVWHYSGGGFDTDFDLAGKEYTMPTGMSIVGKELSPTSWELTFRANGKVFEVEGDAQREHTELGFRRHQPGRQNST